MERILTMSCIPVTEGMDETTTSLVESFNDSGELLQLVVNRKDINEHLEYILSEASYTFFCGDTSLTEALDEYLSLGGNIDWDVDDVLEDPLE